MSEWQPIETAPRIREQPILAYVSDPNWYYGRTIVVKWLGDLMGWSMPWDQRHDRLALDAAAGTTD